MGLWWVRPAGRLVLSGVPSRDAVAVRGGNPLRPHGFGGMSPPRETSYPPSPPKVVAVGENELLFSGTFFPAIFWAQNPHPQTPPPPKAKPPPPPAQEQCLCQNNSRCGSCKFWTVEFGCSFLWLSLKIKVFCDSGLGMDF